MLVSVPGSTSSAGSAGEIVRLLTNKFGIYFSIESLISDSIALNVNPSNGSKRYSYSLVPKSGRKYLDPFRVNNK